MKVESTKHEPAFAPITITITIESAEDLEAVIPYAEQWYTIAYAARAFAKGHPDFAPVNTGAVMRFNTALWEALKTAGVKFRGNR